MRRLAPRYVLRVCAGIEWTDRAAAGPTLPVFTSYASLLRLAARGGAPACAFGGAAKWRSGPPPRCFDSAHFDSSIEGAIFSGAS